MGQVFALAKEFIEMPLRKDDGSLNDYLEGRLVGKKLVTKRGRELLKRNQEINWEDIEEIAEAYVKFHFSDEGQELIAKRFNRPYSEAIAKKHADRLKPLTLFRFKDHFTDWPTVMSVHFGQGAELDKMRKK